MAKNIYKTKKQQQQLLPDTDLQSEIAIDKSSIVIHQEKPKYPSKKILIKWSWKNSFDKFLISEISRDMSQVFTKFTL